MVEIQRVFEANFHVYGMRKVWRQLGWVSSGVLRSRTHPAGVRIIAMVRSPPLSARAR